MTLKLLTAAAVALLTLSAQAQTIYKCKDAKGQTSFQHQPCDGKGTGAISVAPANVVDGNPEGEQGVRSAAARRSEVRAAQERGELSGSMTYEEAMQTLRGPAAAAKLGGQPAAPRGRYERHPSLVPCYSELEIRNATMESSSVTRPLRERLAAQRLERRMRLCTK